MRKLATAVVMVLALVPAGAAQARTDDMAKPVVFVHGLDWEGLAGVSCPDTWDTMRNALRSYGFTGTLDALKYYTYDAGCDHSFNGSGGLPGNYLGNTAHTADGGHTADTDIQHLGYHLAWYLYNNYSSKGITVDLVGHSMGGLIIRYAVAGVQHGIDNWPPYLRVEDAVTLGSPHGGSRWYTAFGCLKFQCRQMDAGASFLKWMETNAWRPQSLVSTDWSSMGSDDDSAVAADRATGTATDRSTAMYFGSCHKVWYRTEANIGHSDFRTATGNSPDVPVYRVSPTNCATGWVSDATYYRPVRQTGYALQYGDR
jgi:hypothetical protein